MKIPDLWKKNRRFPVVSSIIVLCAAAIFFIGYRFHWRTGFADKTFWDWMQLLIVPFMLTIGGLWFSQVQQTKERDVAERNAKTEKDIALDNQRESLLQTYLDRMSELLLDKHLLDEETNKNKAPDLARARTLTALSRLDPVRKGSLVQFLREAGLIKRYKGI